MIKKYGKRRCHMCGEMITKNALGRAAHERNCHKSKLAKAAAGATLNPTMPKTGWPDPKGR